MKQLRNFVFTCNNYTDLHIDKIKSLPDALECNYYIYGKEVSESGTPHLQGYVELHSRILFTKLTKYLDGFHIEARKGTAQQAIQYCSKDGDVEVYGTPKSPGTRTDINTLKQMLLADARIQTILDSEELTLNFQSLRFAEHLIGYYDKPRDYKPTVTWIYGASGTGKTRRAVESLPNAYFKSNGSGKWWPGYDGQEDIIIDDCESYHYPAKYILGLIDRFPFTIEMKGSSRQFRGRNIIITSLAAPDIEYPGSPGFTKQFIRRIDNLIELKE